MTAVHKLRGIGNRSPITGCIYRLYYTFKKKKHNIKQNLDPPK